MKAKTHFEFKFVHEMIIDKLCNNSITCKWCLVPFCGYDLPLVLRWDELEDDVVEARLV